MAIVPHVYIVNLRGKEFECFPREEPDCLPLRTPQLLRVLASQGVASVFLSSLPFLHRTHDEFRTCSLSIFFRVKKRNTECYTISSSKCKARVKDSTIFFLRFNSHKKQLLEISTDRASLRIAFGCTGAKFENSDIKLEIKRSLSGITFIKRTNKIPEIFFSSFGNLICPICHPKTSYTFSIIDLLLRHVDLFHSEYYTLELLYQNSNVYLCEIKDEGKSSRLAFISRAFSVDLGRSRLEPRGFSFIKRKNRISKCDAKESTNYNPDYIVEKMGQKRIFVDSTWMQPLPMSASSSTSINYETEDVIRSALIQDFCDLSQEEKLFMIEWNAIRRTMESFEPIFTSTVSLLPFVQRCMQKIITGAQFGITDYSSCYYLLSAHILSLGELGAIDTRCLDWAIKMLQRLKGLLNDDR